MQPEGGGRGRHDLATGDGALKRRYSSWLLLRARKQRELDRGMDFFYCVREFGIGASRCSDALKFFWGTGWEMEGIDVKCSKNKYGTAFDLYSGGPYRLTYMHGGSD